jgi:hypothetical protein
LPHHDLWNSPCILYIAASAEPQYRIGIDAVIMCRQECCLGLIGGRVAPRHQPRVEVGVIDTDRSKRPCSVSPAITSNGRLSLLPGHHVPYGIPDEALKNPATKASAGDRFAGREVHLKDLLAVVAHHWRLVVILSFLVAAAAYL